MLDPSTGRSGASTRRTAAHAARRSYGTTLDQADVFPDSKPSLKIPAV
jgi:hypothetical protein